MFCAYAIPRTMEPKLHYIQLSIFLFLPNSVIKK